MGTNIVFYFTGTGNSLKVAKEISKALDNCEVASMNSSQQLEVAYDRIGFVFPSYAIGMPLQVEAFIKKLDFSMSRNTYIFAVGTCGNSMGNAFFDIQEILSEKGSRLNYSNKVKMFGNYVALYSMKRDINKSTVKSDESIKPIIRDISNKVSYNKFSKGTLSKLYHNSFIKSIQEKDKGFNVSGTCNGCQTCMKVCPVNNIVMQEGKPSFTHHCEQCMACIQWCPKEAINYKNKTQNRGRYHHPGISLNDMLIK